MSLLNFSILVLDEPESFEKNIKIDTLNINYSSNLDSCLYLLTKKQFKTILINAEKHPEFPLFIKIITDKGITCPIIILTEKNVDYLNSYHKIYKLLNIKNITSDNFMQILMEINKIQCKNINTKQDKLENSKNLITIIDKFGNIKYINSTLKSNLNYDKKTFYNSNLTLYGLSKKEFKRILEKLSKHGHWFNNLICKDKMNNNIITNTNIVPYIDDEYYIIYQKIIDTINDSNSYSKISNSFDIYHIYNYLLKAAVDGFIIHERGKIIKANNIILNMLKTSRNNFIGKLIILFVHPEHRLMVIENITANSSKSQTIKMVRQDGRHIWAILKSKSLIIAGQKVRVTSIRDITKSKENEELLLQAKNEAEKANRSKSEFLAKMSHELRTPLNSIIGFAEVLLAGIDGKLNNNQIESLSRVSNSGKNLLHLINDLLDFSKIEAGKMELNCHNTDIIKVLENCCSIISSIADKKNIKLTLTNKTKNSYAYIDAMKIQQVIINLLSNAIKFTIKGSVDIILTNHKNHLKIEIKDTGIGMSKLQQKEIFNEFTQADKKIGIIYGGTGLGLAISRYLIEMHNGKIWVESEENKGSSFFVSIPKTKFISVNKKNYEKAPINCLGKILLIDDEVEISHILEKYLELEGYYCLSINDSHIAVQTAISYQPNLIILDIMMPGKDGYQVLKELKDFEKTKNIPVLLLSGFCDKQLGEELGAIDCIRKPINRDFLYKKVKSYIKGEKI